MAKAVFAMLLAASVAVVAQQPPPSAPSLLIRNVTVIDGNGGTPQSAVNVLLEGGACRRSAATRSMRTSRSKARVVRDAGTDRAHVHLSGMPWAERAEQLTLNPTLWIFSEGTPKDDVKRGRGSRDERRHEARAGHRRRPCRRVDSLMTRAIRCR